VNTGLKIQSLVKSAGLSDLLATFAACQSAHETAVNGVPWTSQIFRSNNNAFGMKYAGQHEALGEKNGYANYESIENSVADWVSWWVRHRWSPLSLPLFVNSLEGFVKFLKNNNYFEAPESAYLKGCQYFYNLLFT
jgi:hypothetical protein